MINCKVVKLLLRYRHSLFVLKVPSNTNQPLILGPMSKKSFSEKIEVECLTCYSYYILRNPTATND